MKADKGKTLQMNSFILSQLCFIEILEYEKMAGDQVVLFIIIATDIIKKHMFINPFVHPKGV